MPRYAERTDVASDIRDAPALPWQCEDEDGDRLGIADARPLIAVGIEGHAVHLTAEQARQAAAVLLRAANESEAGR